MSRRPAVIFRIFLILSLVASSAIVFFSTNDIYLKHLYFNNKSKKQVDNKKTFIILDVNGYMATNTDYFVDNCLVTKNKSAIAHAVVVTLRRYRSVKDLPPNHLSWQRWVMLLDESPYNAGSNLQNDMFNNFFNWTMTYRKDSDVYCPYGNTLKTSVVDQNLLPIGNRKQLVVAVISNCYIAKNRRMIYLNSLNKTINITLFGKCGKRMCRGYNVHHPAHVCKELNEFLFYLAFENSNCEEYITEKLFANGFGTGAVPVVMGASKHDYTAVSPPNSFIHVTDFESPRKLGEYLLYLSKNMTAYMEYHQWRKTYKTFYRLQFEDKLVWKPLCNKLNKDDGIPKTVGSIKNYWSLSMCNSTVPW